jgi:hypothetical protein
MTGLPGLSGTEWPVLVPLFVRTEGVLDEALGWLPGSPWPGCPHQSWLGDDHGGDRHNLLQMRNAKTTASVASDAVLIVSPGMLASHWPTLEDGLPREGGSWFQAGMKDWPPWPAARPARWGWGRVGLVPGWLPGRHPRCCSCGWMLISHREVAA